MDFCKWSGLALNFVQSYWPGRHIIMIYNVDDLQFSGKRISNSIVFVITSNSSTVIVYCCDSKEIA